MAILTISRQFGSGIREIRQRIASTLNYAYVDKESILNEIRTRGGKWEQWAREFDQTSPSIWEKHDWSFIGFAAILQSVLLSHAIRDNVILAGRGTNFLLEGIPHAYRVRFVASTEQRVERVVEWKSVDRKTAGLIAKQTDRDRAGFVKALYGKDLSDVRGYDAVYDTDLTPADDIVAQITEALVARDKFNTPEAQELLRIRAMAARVKSALVTDPQLYVPTLKVEPTESALVLSGIVHNANQYKLIEEAAKLLARNVPLEVKLRLRA
jgi:cytidylate kinase